ncbi:MAG: GAF domain-containing protein [Candidatus Sumerlaeaceae bacterium]|nr:GAF domain-containing protein [Candidatus Sumerlaeaceae bacterium]
MKPARKPTRKAKPGVRFQKYKVLYRISDLINSTTKSDTLLRRVLRETVQEIHADFGSVRLLDADGEHLDVVATHDPDANCPKPPRLKVGEGVMGWTAKTGKPMRVADVRKSEHYVQVRPDVRSEMAVPLMVEEEVIGVLNVDSKDIGAFSEEDEKLLKAIGNQTAKVVQTWRLYDRLAEQTRRIEALFDVGQALISPDPLPEVLKKITSAVMELIEIRQCSIMVLNEKRELVLSAVSGESKSYAQMSPSSLALPTMNDMSVQRQPLQVYEVKKAPRAKPRKISGQTAPSSMVSVPIFFHDTLIGMLNIYNSRPRQIGEDEMRLLDGFASLCGIAIENAQRYERVLKAEHSIRQTDRLATLGILSAEIAHEVRNPVTIISMLIHSLREDKAVTPTREKDMAIISEKLERINKIVSQVLNFSKRREPHLEWVSLNVVIEDLLFLVKHNLAARQILVKRSLDEALPDVLGDRGDFDQVFLNLLLNAMDAMKTGGILTIRTEIEKLKAGRFVVVTIRDTGVGIDPEIIPQLFSPFFSTRREGIGLGLFVSQKLLSQYGADINVRSTPSKGTTFTVKISLEAPPT